MRSRKKKIVRQILEILRLEGRVTFYEDESGKKIWHPTDEEYSRA